MTTTINNEHKKLNVPNLRFKEFEGEWSVTTLQKDCKVNPTNEKIADKFVYVDLESVTQGQLNKHQILTKEEAPSRAQRVLHTDDILFQCVRPYQMNNYMVKDAMSNIQWVASTGYAQIRTQIDYPTFLYYVLNTPKYNKAVMVRCTGSSYPAINSDDLSKIPFYKCGIAEQRKIATFLSLLDERIATQNKVIDKLQSLIKGISKQLLMNNQNWRTVRIGELLRIGNGKDYKHLGIGKIPVYGTGGQMLLVNDYLYDGESVCIGRKGTIDTPMFLKGKFWTVDTLFYTYDFKDVLPKFCYYLFLQINWKLYNEGTGVPSLSKSTIENIKVKIPSIEQQHNICSVLDCYEHKIKNEEQILELYLSEKQYLLRQMFI